MLPCSPGLMHSMTSRSASTAETGYTKKGVGVDKSQSSDDTKGSRVRTAAGKRLAEQNHVWTDVIMFTAKHLAGAAKALHQVAEAVIKLRMLRRKHAQNAPFGSRHK